MLHRIHKITNKFFDKQQGGTCEGLVMFVVCGTHCQRPLYLQPALMQDAVSATSSSQRSRPPRQEMAAWTLSGSCRMTNERTKQYLYSARSSHSARLSAMVTTNTDCNFTYWTACVCCEVGTIKQKHGRV